ncbi:MAG: acyltransferase [Pseudomonadota bacterium]
MSRPGTIGAAMAHGRAPGLDAIRLCAALSVVISHAWPLSGHAEPVARLTGLSLGGLAVLVFFALSGFLIADSAARHRHRKGRFVAARIRRIFPGLLGALCVTVVIAAACGSDAGWHAQVRYIVKGLSLVSIEHRLAVAFSDNPIPLAVNGPLWTLAYEVLCYGVIAILLWLAPGRAGWRVPALTLGALMLCLLSATGMLPAGALGYRLAQTGPLAFAFGLGALAWQCRQRVVLNGYFAFALLAAAATLSCICRDETAAVLSLAPALGYAALTIGYSPYGRALPGDISFGVYIYGWPVAQAIVHVAGPMAPGALALASCLAVLPFAIVSWVAVERPMLTRGRGIVARERAAPHGA